MSYEETKRQTGRALRSAPQGEIPLSIAVVKIHVYQRHCASDGGVGARKATARDGTNITFENSGV